MSDYDGGTCHCGSAWFVLRPEGGVPAQFTIDRNGAPTGYHGTPVCGDCLEPWTPPRERLRVVGGS